MCLAIRSPRFVDTAEWIRIERSPRDHYRLTARQGVGTAMIGRRLKAPYGWSSDKACCQIRLQIFRIDRGGRLGLAHSHLHREHESSITKNLVAPKTSSTERLAKTSRASEHPKHSQVALCHRSPRCDDKTGSCLPLAPCPVCRPCREVSNVTTKLELLLNIGEVQ